MLIASRTFKLTRDVPPGTDVSVRIFEPYEDNRSWFCKVEIDGPDGLRVKKAGGQDSMQALILALNMIGIELNTGVHYDGELYWNKPGQGYGFPVPNNIRDLLQGDDANFF